MRIEPVTLCEWPDWLGSGTQGRERLGEQSHRLIGGAKAPWCYKTYNRCFRKWAEFRELQGKDALIWPHENSDLAEKDILRFCSLHLGPLRKSAATVELYLRALSYVHKLHTGINPLTEMFRAELFLQGARREEGPPYRKLPISCEDLLGIYHGIAPGCINERITFCVILLGWFSCCEKASTYAQA